MNNLELKYKAQLEFFYIYTGGAFPETNAPGWVAKNQEKLKPFTRGAGDTRADCGRKFDNYMAMRMKGAIGG